MCPDRDSGDLPLCSRCGGFDRRRFVEVSSSQWELMTIRRVMGFTRRRETFLMASQMRKDDFLSRAIALVHRDECLDTIKVS